MCSRLLGAGWGAYLLPVVIVAQKHAIPQLHSVSRTIRAYRKSLQCTREMEFAWRSARRREFSHFFVLLAKFSRELAQQTVRAKYRT
jgi:hypothetical protein